jgi:hypothetical protein
MALREAERRAIEIPARYAVKAWFGLDAFYLPLPTNLKHKAIREYRILPRNGCFYLELIYKTENVQSDVDPSKALMILIYYLNSAKNQKGGNQAVNELSADCIVLFKVC